MRVRACLFASLIAGTVLAPLVAGAAQGCAVTGLDGQVASVRAEGAWSSLGAGPLPNAADTVRTGPVTRLEITCDDGTVLTIGPQSEFALGELMAQPEASVVMRLLGGIVGLVVAPQDGRSVAVQTPVAIASVRSTEWLVEHVTTGGGAGAQTAVFVREGSVAVANDVADLLLEAGQGVTVARGAVVRPVGAWGPARLAEVNAALGFGWQ